MGGRFVLALARPNGKGWGLDQTETSLAASLAGSRAERELDQFVERRHTQRVTGAEDVYGEKHVEDYDLEAQWKKLAEEHRADRGEAVGELWCRYHLRQAARLRTTLGELVEHHEKEARRWQGA
jgi:hypothetical protein